MVGVTDTLSLRERVEQYQQRHPEAEIPQIAGALGVTPLAVQEVLYGDAEQKSEDGPEQSGDGDNHQQLNSGTGDRVPRPGSGQVQITTQGLICRRWTPKAGSTCRT
ncbi:hypothetical protein VB779_08590 [Haloarculaceae archaeon H-GB11]|nr:hypothetical protein [Haloarculaceae archaeon H-GB11]